MALVISLSLAGCPTNQWEQAILDKHNEWRSNTQPPAKDMYNLRWDSAIAANMYNWLARCDSNWPHSDQDRDRKNVGGYEYLGENLAYCAGTACEAPIDGIVGYLGQSWWDEKDDYNWATDSSYGGVTSHYTQMSSSNIYAIGCAAVECPSPGPYGWNGKWWEIGCQYGERGQGYWVGTKPFEQGSGGLIEPDMSLLQKHPGICVDTPSTDAPPPPTPTPQTPTAVPTTVPTTMAPVPVTATPTTAPVPVTVTPTASPSRVTAVPTMTPSVMTSAPVPSTMSPVASMSPTATTAAPVASTPTPMTTNAPMTTGVPAGATVAPTTAPMGETETPTATTESPSRATESPNGATESPPVTSVPNTVSPSGSTSTPVPNTEAPARPTAMPSGESAAPTMAPGGGETPTPSGQTPVPTTMAPPGSSATPVPSTQSPRWGAGNGEETDDDDSGSNWWVWLLVSLAVLLALCAMIAFAIMKRKQATSISIDSFMSGIDPDEPMNVTPPQAHPETINL